MKEIPRKEESAKASMGVTIDAKVMPMIQTTSFIQLFQSLRKVHW